MKKLFALMAVVLVIIATFAPGASAHVLQTDGTIGGILHILPDDNPSSDTPTTIEVAFNDRAGNFTIRNCDCGLQLVRNGHAMDSQPLQEKGQDATGTVTFPGPGVYVLSVTGTPRQGSAFKQFTLDYTVRVAGKTSYGGIPVLLWAGLLSAAALAMLAGYAQNLRYNQAYKKEE